MPLSQGGPAVGGAGGPLIEALTVLRAMGLPPAAAEQALRRASTEDPTLVDDLERWVRFALRYI